MSQAYTRSYRDVYFDGNYRTFYIDVLNPSPGMSFMPEVGPTEADDIYVGLKGDVWATDVEEAPNYISIIGAPEDGAGSLMVHEVAFYHFTAHEFEQVASLQGSVAGAHREDEPIGFIYEVMVDGGIEADCVRRDLESEVYNTLKKYWPLPRFVYLEDGHLFKARGYRVNEHGDDLLVHVVAESGETFLGLQVDWEKTWKQKGRENEIETGTVIHGTLREADLIPAFLEELEKINPENVAGLKDDEYYQDLFDKAREDGWEAAVEAYPDESTYLLHEDLFPLLEQDAPPGFYFGAHEGDGSDFGWWEVENE